MEPGTFTKRRKNEMNGEWLGVELFGIIEGMVHIVRSSYAISLFDLTLH